MGERVLGVDEVGGSSPPASTRFFIFGEGGFEAEPNASFCLHQSKVTVLGKRELSKGR